MSTQKIKSKFVIPAHETNATFFQEFGILPAGDWINCSNSDNSDNLTHLKTRVSWNKFFNENSNNSSSFG